MATIVQAIRLALHYGETHLGVTDVFGEDVVPPLEESGGCTGFWLVDRERGKRISVMVWESEEAAQEAFARIGERVSARIAAHPDFERPKPVSVERFEIYAQV